MEILFAFIAGVVLASVVAFVVVKKIIGSRAEQAELSARLKVESAFQAEKVGLQADLKHAQERVKEVKAEAEKVYSATYLMSIYETMFVGYVEQGVNDIIYARYYDSPDGLKMLKESDVWVTEKRIYDYDSMKIVRPSKANRITVEIDSHLEGSSEGDAD